MNTTAPKIMHDERAMALQHGCNIDDYAIARAAGMTHTQCLAAHFAGQDLYVFALSQAHRIAPNMPFTEVN